jgi:heterodisulfide reductase subunit C
MEKLKQIAYRHAPKRFKSSIFFYQEFLGSVRRHGRVREMEFMTLYFTHMKNPLLPIRFTSLGLKLLNKGKLPLQIPSKGSGKLNTLFQAVDEVENIK